MTTKYHTLLIVVVFQINSLRKQWILQNYNLVIMRLKICHKAGVQLRQYQGNILSEIRFQNGFFLTSWLVTKDKRYISKSFYPISLWCNVECLPLEIDIPW